MNPTKRVRRLATGLVTAVLLALPGALPVQAQTPGTLDVYQDSVCDGGSVLISGSGWPGSTFVHLRFDGTPLWGTITGANGNIATWRTLPSGHAPATYFVAAYLPAEPEVEDFVFAGVEIEDC